VDDTEIIALTRQSARWLYAAQQDTDLVVRHLHLNYAVSIFDTLAESTAPEHLHALTGVEIGAVREAARAAQDRTQRELIALVQQGETAGYCPSLPSSQSAYDAVMGQPGAWLIVLRDLLGRAGLIGLAMFAAGEREHLLRNSLAGGLGIEAFVMGWIWLHAPPHPNPNRALVQLMMPISTPAQITAPVVLPAGQLIVGRHGIGIYRAG
jgi:hypothetical protein